MSALNKSIKKLSMIEQFKNLYFKARDKFHTAEFHISQYKHKKYFNRKINKIKDNTDKSFKIINKIGFYLHGNSHWAHLEPIFRHLPKEKFELVTPAIKDIPEPLGSSPYKVSNTLNLLASRKRYQSLVSLYMAIPEWLNDQHVSIPKYTEREYFNSLALNNVRMTYSLGARSEVLPKNMLHYDSLFVYGPYDEKLYSKALENHVSISQVGYPRFDAFFSESPSKNEILREHNLDPRKSTILWLPSKGKLSSIDKYLEMASSLTGKYNILLKPHPQESERKINSAKEKGIRLSAYNNNSLLYKVADFAICDYGGSPFGALYTDTNLILLTPDGVNYDENYSPDSPDVLLRNEIPPFTSIEPNKFIHLLQDIELWKKQKITRSKLRKTYFRDNYGTSGESAARKLLSEIT